MRMNTLASLVNLALIAMATNAFSEEVSVE